MNKITLLLLLFLLTAVTQCSSFGSPKLIDFNKEKYPGIKAFVWHNVDNREETINNLLENSDWRINSSLDCLGTAKEALSDKYYFDRPIFRQTEKVKCPQSRRVNFARRYK